jgi:hypothetical protein
MCCLVLAVAVCSFGSVNAAGVCFSPPDLSHFIAETPIAALAAATLVVPSGTMAEKIKDYFARYPNSQEVYENGGVLFHERGYADSYGKTETKKYTRQSLSIKTEIGDKELAVEQLSAIEDLTLLPYKIAQKLVKDLELKTADNKQETLVQALLEYKTANAPATRLIINH